MHPDQDAEHPWLGGEVDFIRVRARPRACRSSASASAPSSSPGRRARPSGPPKAPEVGWFTVELNEDGAADPVLGALPRSVRGVPVALLHLRAAGRGGSCSAENENARQAYRLGDRTWAIQFHAEVERHMLDRWFVEGAAELPKPRAEMEAETGANLATWNEHGRALCGAFLDQRQGCATGSEPVAQPRRPRADAAGRVAATTRATSRRSSAPRTLPRRAPAPRAPSGCPSGSRRSPRRRGVAPTSRARTPRRAPRAAS